MATTDRMLNGAKTKVSSARIVYPQEYSGSNTLDKYTQGVYVANYQQQIGTTITKLRPINDDHKVIDGRIQYNRSPAFNDLQREKIISGSVTVGNTSGSTGYTTAPSSELLDYDFGQVDSHQDGSSYVEDDRTHPLRIMSLSPSEKVFPDELTYLTKPQFIDATIEPLTIRNTIDRHVVFDRDTKDTPWFIRGTRADLGFTDSFRRSVIVDNEEPTVQSRIGVDNDRDNLDSAHPYKDVVAYFGPVYHPETLYIPDNTILPFEDKRRTRQLTLTNPIEYETFLSRIDIDPWVDLGFNRSAPYNDENYGLLNFNFVVYKSSLSQHTYTYDPGDTQLDEGGGGYGGMIPIGQAQGRPPTLALHARLGGEYGSITVDDISLGLGSFSNDILFMQQTDEREPYPRSETGPYVDDPVITDIDSISKPPRSVQYDIRSEGIDNTYPSLSPNTIVYSPSPNDAIGDVSPAQLTIDAPTRFVEDFGDVNFSYTERGGHAQPWAMGIWLKEIDDVSGLPTFNYDDSSSYGTNISERGLIDTTDAATTGYTNRAMAYDDNGNIYVVTDSTSPQANPSISYVRSYTRNGELRWESNLGVQYGAVNIKNSPVNDGLYIITKDVGSPSIKRELAKVDYDGNLLWKEHITGVEGDGGYYFLDMYGYEPEEGPSIVTAMVASTQPNNIYKISIVGGSVDNATKVDSLPQDSVRDTFICGTTKVEGGAPSYLPHVFLKGSNDAFVTRYDYQTGEAINQIPLGNKNFEYNIDYEGNVYTVHVDGLATDGNLRKYDPDGNLILEFAHTGEAPSDTKRIFVDGDQNIYIAYYGSGAMTIRKFSPTGTALWEYSKDSSERPVLYSSRSNQFEAFVVGSDHVCFCQNGEADNSNDGKRGGIESLNASDGTLAWSNQESVYSITLDSDGNHICIVGYPSNAPSAVSPGGYSRGSIVSYDLNGNLNWAIDGLITHAGGGLECLITTDVAGNIYVSDPVENIWKIDQDGNIIWRISTQSDPGNLLETNIDGLRALPEGGVIAAVERGQLIITYDADGNETHRASGAIIDGGYFEALPGVYASAHGLPVTGNTGLLFIAYYCRPTSDDPHISGLACFDIASEAYLWDTADDSVDGHLTTRDFSYIEPDANEELYPTQILASSDEIVYIASPSSEATQGQAIQLIPALPTYEEEQVSYIDPGLFNPSLAADYNAIITTDDKGGFYIRHPDTTSQPPYPTTVQRFEGSSITWSTDEDITNFTETNGTQYLVVSSTGEVAVMSRDTGEVVLIAQNGPPTRVNIHSSYSAVEYSPNGLDDSLNDVNPDYGYYSGKNYLQSHVWLTLNPAEEIDIASLDFNPTSPGDFFLNKDSYATINYATYMFDSAGNLDAHVLYTYDLPMSVLGAGLDWSLLSWAQHGDAGDDLLNKIIEDENQEKYKLEGSSEIAEFLSLVNDAYRLWVDSSELAPTRILIENKTEAFRGPTPVQDYNQSSNIAHRNIHFIAGAAGVYDEYAEADIEAQPVGANDPSVYHMEFAEPTMWRVPLSDLDVDPVDTDWFNSNIWNGNVWDVIVGLTNVQGTFDIETPIYDTRPTGRGGETYIAELARPGHSIADFGNITRGGGMIYNTPEGIDSIAFGGLKR